MGRDVTPLSAVENLEGFVPRLMQNSLDHLPNFLSM